MFGVPIRTVVPENNRDTMNTGSGIVIDSQAAKEFRECMLKAEIWTRGEKLFELLGSILWNDGYILLSDDS